MVTESKRVPSLFRDPADPNSFSYLDFALSCMIGIGVAGLFYPIVVVTYTFFRVLIPQAIYFGPGIDLIEGLFFFIGPLLIGCLMGFVFALISAWMSGLLIYAFNTSLGNPLRPKVFISCVGGLAGFAPISIAFLHPESLAGNPDAIEAIVIGPCLAALVGQTGARWWARKRTMFPSESRQHLLAAQFQISHVLALTAWLAVTLAILRLATETNLPLLVAIYFPVQLVCLGIGHWLDRFVEWRSGIQYIS